MDTKTKPQTAAPKKMAMKPRPLEPNNPASPGRNPVKAYREALADLAESATALSLSLENREGIPVSDREYQLIRMALYPELEERMRNMRYLFLAGEDTFHEVADLEALLREVAEIK